ncbi:MAG: family transcriptional regulator [Herbinix sp.]|jgi:transcriptional regulator with XRE-family HTH domain|nr:family transcriptional regulator [Herbinix sp.]
MEAFIVELTIWQARNDRKVTIEELSVMTGISTGALSNYENNKKYPRINQLEKIAIALDTKISNLYNSSYK